MYAYGLLVAAAALVSTASACDRLVDTDIYGNDIGNTRGDVNSCDSACTKNSLCATWTWSSFNGGTCWLKSRSPLTQGGPAFIKMAGVTATTCIFNEQKVCNQYKDIDFVGMDIASKTNKAEIDCCNVCEGYSGCTAYAWNADNNGTCWLKKSVGHVISKLGVISSSLIPLYGEVCPFEYDTDFENNDVGNAPAKDAGVCCSLCKASQPCNAYSWSNYNGGTCWMKSGKGRAVYKAGVISAKLA